MDIPLRVIRSAMEAVGRNSPDIVFSVRDWRCRENILVTGEHILARFGHGKISFRAFAGGMRLSRSTLERHFVDLNALLGEILLSHLRKIAAAIGNVPRGTPDRRKAQRAVYLNAARDADGEFTDAHLLLIRDRAKLPPDLLDMVDGMYHGIAIMLADTETAVDTMEILDSPGLTRDEIELLLSGDLPAEQPARTKTPPPDEAEVDLSCIAGIYLEKPPPHPPPEREAA